jgi:hypothetical protein
MRPFQNFVQHKMAEPFDWANNVIYITARPPPKLVFWSRIVVIQGDFPLQVVREEVFQCDFLPGNIILSAASQFF